jgi:bifunctional enzyme CysN/CysC
MRTGRVVLLRDGEAAGGALVLDVVNAEAPSFLVPVGHAVSRAERESRHHHRGGVLWLTGLSGAGKSTLALGLERMLFKQGLQAFALDGDGIRGGLARDLGFTPQDRSENIRRVAEVAKLFAESGHIAIVALISPTIADRAHARAIIGEGFAEIYVKADVKTCESRDPKGFYAKARAGDIKGFTGVDAGYEVPETADLDIDTGAATIEDSIRQLYGFAISRFGEKKTENLLPSYAI